MRTTSPETLMILKNLGVSVRGNYNIEDEYDPEALVIKSLKLYWTDNSSFFLVLKSLRTNLGHLININRLIKLVEVSQISNDELCLLIAICNILEKEIDRNFSLVQKKIYKKSMILYSPPERETDPYLIKENGLEESLIKFNVKVRKFYDESEKKLTSFENLLKVNPWLKFRTVIGSNTRSDVLYLISRNFDANQSTIAKKAYCTKQSVNLIISHLNNLKINNLLDLRKTDVVERK